MDGFSYNDIFETKGLEYLIIIVFLCFLIPFWMLLNKQSKMAKNLQKAWGSLSAHLLKVPQGLYFSGNHTWMFMEKSGKAKVGLDDLLVHLTGALSFKQVCNSGEIVRKGDLLTEVRQGGKMLKIFSPISGMITEINPDLNGFASYDPYGKGWFCRIKPSNWMEETRNCYFGEQASEFSRKEFDRFKDFLSRTMVNYSPEAAMIIMQDGGEICDQPLSDLPAEVWNRFQNEFLDLP